MPTSDYSRENKTLGSARFTVTPNLQIGESGLSLAVVNFVRYWFQRQDLQSGSTDLTLPRLMLYTAPILSYSIRDNFSVWGMLEATMSYDTFGFVNTDDPNRSLMDLEPGFDFKLSDHVTISPYLNWFVNRPLNTTSINFMAHLSI